MLRGCMWPPFSTSVSIVGGEKGVEMSTVRKSESFLEQWWMVLVILFGIGMVAIFLTYNPSN